MVIIVNITTVIVIVVFPILTQGTTTIPITPTTRSFARTGW